MATSFTSVETVGLQDQALPITAAEKGSELLKAADRNQKAAEAYQADGQAARAADLSFEAAYERAQADDMQERMKDPSLVDSRTAELSQQVAAKGVAAEVTNNRTEAQRLRAEVERAQADIAHINSPEFPKN